MNKIKQLKHILFFICVLTISGLLSGQGSGNSLSGTGAVYLDCGPSITDLNFPYTMEVWVKIPPGPGTPHPIWSSGHNAVGLYYGAWLLITVSGQVDIAYGDGTGAGSADRRSSFSDVPIPYGEWVHICAIQVGPLSSRMYINGIEVPVSYDGTGGTTMVHDPAGRQIVGYQQSYVPGVYMEGEIDELRIWRTARTEEEIRANMCRKLSGTEPGLESYWRFDEGAGTAVADLSGNDHNGNFVGAMTWQVSGAALGDASVYTYPESWDGVSLSIEGPDDERFSAQDVLFSDDDGLHVYRVDELPNTTAGLPPGTEAPYYGVFSTRPGVFYSILASVSDSACAQCTLEWASRNDNAAGPWVAVSGIPSFNACQLSKNSESSIGESRRAEYALASTLSLDDCSDDTTIVVPENPCVIKLPNAFSPNSDGINDVFGLPLSMACPELPIFNMEIYNRWGQKIWHSEDPNLRWDGTFMGVEQELGVYVWTLTYQTTTEEALRQEAGTISLIR